MDVRELCLNALESADQYYEYLKQTGKGEIRYHVQGKLLRDGSVAQLRVNANITHPDSLRVSIGGRQYSQEEITVISYDDKMKTVSLQLQENVIDAYDQADASELLLSTDLTFLVERIRTWLDQYGDNINMQLDATAATSPFRVNAMLSDEQRTAVWGALSNHVSYVWGAPGSGKTSSVLTESLKYYIAQEQRVVITAPTNESLDRALVGVLKALERDGYNPAALALRMGVPTKHLCENYPGVCEDFTANKKVAALEQQANQQHELMCADLISPDEFHLAVADIDAKQEKWLPRTSARRLANIKILAITIDSYIGKLQSEQFRYTAQHVFLDEAGYCPIIKVLPLLTANTALTMLGDHRQLPPVCVMSFDEIKKEENQPIALWAQSAAYLETLMNSDTVETFAASYLRGDPPDFRKLARFNLLRSYRFGDSLGAVLSDAVYEGKLRGIAPNGTEMLVLDAPKDTAGARSSNAEAEAILQYLQEHSDIGEYTVLTPYCNQVDLLRKKLNVDNIDDRVMTVHRSQGREWNTVFFSAVDTDDMYFTNSAKRASHGLEVVNTAVSRAKRRLIIVCDATYWSTQYGQLLCKIVQQAQLDCTEKPA